MGIENEKATALGEKLPSENPNPELQSTDLKNAKSEVLEFIEFETKYETVESNRFPFKKIMEDTFGLVGEKFLYVQSGDEYFTIDFETIAKNYLESRMAEVQSGYQKSMRARDEALLVSFMREGLCLPPFLRFRASEDKRVRRKELTFKKKQVAHNNIQRNEVNLRVDASDNETIEAFAEGLGYTHEFSVYKYCDIYYAEDATLVFYSVKEDSGRLSHFMEIEVNEDLEFTEEEGWAIVRKWEKALEPLGIKHQNRKRQSLFEMFRRRK